MTDYRTLAIVDALTSMGVDLLPWQVEALDRKVEALDRMMLELAAEDEDSP